LEERASTFPLARKESIAKSIPLIDCAKGEDGGVLLQNGELGFYFYMFMGFCSFWVSL
jgi:hypothetical protein